MNNPKMFLAVLTLFCSVNLYPGFAQERDNDLITKINTESAQEKPYVILVSLDGFRWDYVDKYAPENLVNFVKQGVKATSLIPSFPTKTFTNHYTIATGLYPDKNGIIGNNFYDVDTDFYFSMSDEGQYYKGSPIWNEANNAGMVTASYFFVGTGFDINGIQPTYTYPYDGKVSNETRVNQVLDWLAMDAAHRPHFISLYFSDIDDAGHEFGPSNEVEMAKALAKVDQQLGLLFDGVKKTGLEVNIVIVSDHGMIDQQTNKQLAIETIENPELYTLVSNGALVSVHLKEGVSYQEAFDYLEQHEDHFKVYNTKETPGFEYVPTNKNYGPIQVLPDYGYYFSSARRIASLKENDRAVTGIHGIDSKYKEMHGIFYANGPAFKSGAEISSVKNIHVYPLLCEILGITPPQNIDGDLREAQEMLKE